MVSSLMNMPIQPNKAIVGRNAFAHSSGIHQDGVLKNRESYEIIDPKDVGIDDNAIVLTARSGRAALKHRLQVLGVELSQEKLDKVYEEFLKLAEDRHGYVSGGSDFHGTTGRFPEKVGVFTVDAKAVKALLDHVEGNLKKSR